MTKQAPASQGMEANRQVLLPGCNQADAAALCQIKILTIGQCKV